MVDTYSLYLLWSKDHPLVAGLVSHAELVCRESTHYGPVLAAVADNYSRFISVEDKSDIWRMTKLSVASVQSSYELCKISSARSLPKGSSKHISHACIPKYQVTMAVSYCNTVKNIQPELQTGFRRHFRKLSYMASCVAIYTLTSTPLPA